MGKSRKILINGGGAKEAAIRKRIDTKANKKQLSKRRPNQGELTGRQKRRRDEIEERKNKRRKCAKDTPERRADARQRMRAKLYERQVKRLSDDTPMSERCDLLMEAANAFWNQGKSKMALQTFQKVLELDPADSQFVRTPVLCLLMDEAQPDKARAFLQSELFTSVLCRQPDGKQVEYASETRIASVVGHWTAALIEYISVEVLEEDAQEPIKALESEARLQTLLEVAHKVNPFVSEFIAFAPAFESFDSEFSNEIEPPTSNTPVHERPLLEALYYAITLGQAAIWLDTNEDVRQHIRRTLLETESPDDEPPLAPLNTTGKNVWAHRWKHARTAAMELWVEEMSEESEENSSVSSRIFENKQAEG